MAKHRCEFHPNGGRTQCQNLATHRIVRKWATNDDVLRDDMWLCDSCLGKAKRLWERLRTVTAKKNGHSLWEDFKRKELNRGS